MLPGMCETPPTRGQERMYSNEQRIKGCLWHVDSNTTKPITRPAEHLGEAHTVSEGQVLNISRLASITGMYDGKNATC